MANLYVFLFCCAMLSYTGAQVSSLTPHMLNGTQNLLRYLNISDPSLDSGQIFCPEPGLNDTYKQNMIYIGVFGCEIDPFMYTLSAEERMSLQLATNDSVCYPDLPGYLPPISEFLLALLLHVEELNNRTDILPYHKVCLLSGITRTVNISEAFHQFVENTKMVAFIDMARTENSVFLQHLVLPTKTSIVRFAQYRNLFQVTGHDVWNAVDRAVNGGTLPVPTPRVPIAQNQFETYFFTAEPSNLKVHYAFLALAEYYGWKQIAVVLADSWSDSNLQPGFNRVYAGSRLTAYFFGYKQVGGELLNLFRMINAVELRIIVFHGTVDKYFRTLLAATQFQFVGPDYVWIFPYAGATFPDMYQPKNLWCSFTDKEIYIIKNALKGTLAMGINGGVHQRFEDFEARFVDFADRVTGFRQVYEQNERFQQTALVYDIAGIVTKALQNIVLAKADQLNITEAEVNISSEDRQNLSSQLHEVMYDDTITGNLSFTAEGYRETAHIIVRNFIPIQNDNFTVNSSKDFDPWVLETRACLLNSEDQGVYFNFVFFDANGTVALENTIVFASGNTTAPPDRPTRPYTRSFTRTWLSTSVCTLVFFLIGMVYVVWIYGQDKKRARYNSSWIFNENDIHYITENRQQGIWGRLNNITKLMGVKRIGNTEEAVKLNDGNIAVLIRVSIAKNAINQKVYQECNIMRDLKHPNICPFYGCLVADTKSALLYKYYPRGTLDHILENSDIDFLCVFRLSFALDVSNGMEYLHSKKIIHGRLKTRNCVVDENWIVKLRDYGLEDLRAMSESYSYSQNKHSNRSANKLSLVKMAPEIRLLGSSASQAADVYSFGYFLQELIHAKPSTSFGSTTKLSSTKRELGISPKLFNLICDCLGNIPGVRPSFESITTQLTEISQKEHNNAGHGVMQVYSRQLEERLEELSDKVTNQRDRHNEIMQHYIPKSMVEAIKSEKDVSIKEYKDVAIVCIEQTCDEIHSGKLNAESIAYTMLTMQRAIEGITATYDVKKIHSSGNMWILAAGIHTAPQTNYICEAANAAIAVLHMFSGIFLPGKYHNEHPTVRIGIHLGNIQCGVIEEPVPQLIAIGDSITTAIVIANNSKDGQVLSSWKIGEELRNCPEFIITKNQNVRILDKKVPTMWVKALQEESSNGNQSPENLTLPLNSNVTIKQCIMRKQTLSSISDIDKTPSTPRPVSKLCNSLPAAELKQRFRGARSISEDKSGVQKRLSSTSLASSTSNATRSLSSVHLRFNSIDSELADNEGPGKRRFKSVSLAKLAWTSSARPWSACSEPARLIDLDNTLDDKSIP